MYTGGAELSNLSIHQTKQDLVFLATDRFTQYIHVCMIIHRASIYVHTIYIYTKYIQIYYASLARCQ
jgi:hypothetical protein